MNDRELIWAKERIWRNRALLDLASKHVKYDFKDFVDFPLQRRGETSIEEVLERVKLHANQLLSKGDISKGEWEQFMRDHFTSCGSDIEPCPCPSSTSTPFLERGLPHDMNHWKEYLIKVYDQLHVRCADSAISSLIPLPRPFVIPGGRFREAYYWDTYWTSLGLNLCGKLETARGMIDNFVHLVETIGFVPLFFLG